MNKITAVVQEDLEAIAAIEQMAQQFPWRLTQFESSLQEGHQAWKLCIDGNIVAYTIWREVLDEAELLTIAVSPRFQGRGLGQHLFHFMLDQCRKRQVAQCFLEVAENNNSAICFYLRHGCVEIDRRKNYYQPGSVTAIVMKKLIATA